MFVKTTYKDKPKFSEAEHAQYLKHLPSRPSSCVCLYYDRGFQFLLFALSLFLQKNSVDLSSSSASFVTLDGARGFTHSLISSASRETLDEKCYQLRSSFNALFSHRRLVY